MNEIKRIDPTARYSAASVHAGVVYLAGQVAAHDHLDAAGQTQEVLNTIDALLEKAGTHKKRILMAQIFLADMADYAAMNGVWDAWVDRESPPSRATVGRRFESFHTDH